MIGFTLLAYFFLVFFGSFFFHSKDDRFHAKFHYFSCFNEVKFQDGKNLTDLH